MQLFTEQVSREGPSSLQENVHFTHLNRAGVLDPPTSYVGSLAFQQPDLSCAKGTSGGWTKERNEGGITTIAKVPQWSLNPTSWLPAVPTPSYTEEDQGASQAPSRVQGEGDR